MLIIALRDEVVVMVRQEECQQVIGHESLRGVVEPVRFEAWRNLLSDLLQEVAIIEVFANR